MIKGLVQGATLFALTLGVPAMLMVAMDHYYDGRKEASYFLVGAVLGIVALIGQIFLLR